MPLPDLLNRCIARWQSEDIPLATPLPEDEIRGVWEHLGQPLSRDVLTLYRTLGGFADYIPDDDFFWCLWPWDDLRSWNSRDSEIGVCFCDHSIKLVTWEVRFEDEARSSVWHRGPSGEHQTATDLESFFRTYLDDPWQLL